MRRTLVLASTLSSAHSLAVGVKSKKPAIQGLLESATTMLKNGATPAVVEFAEATLGDVGGVVMPAIINESLNDQRFITNLHSRFQAIRDTLTTSNREVFQLNSEETTKSGEHQTCRHTERNDQCEGKRNCEMELHGKWTQWVECEDDLREIHGRIESHFCPPDANGTLHTFRVTSVPMMQQYMIKVEECHNKEAEYDALRPECVLSHNALNTKSLQCNDLQTELEEKACQHAGKITDVLTEYYSDYAQAESAYNCAVEEVMQLERDRKREWITLQVVNCLLERIREQNGVPCDDTNGGVTEEVGICEERHSLAVCNADDGGDPQLCLDYHEILPHPDNCPARDQVIGECLPVVQATPCCMQWHRQEIEPLPEMPRPPFSETNPGCNEIPPCNDCPDLPTPGPSTIDSCPGYTMDGCTPEGQAAEHNLTYVRSVEGLADVRCCSIDGNTCQSQDFEGGVTFSTPGGGTHTGCYYDVTYQQAMTVCHNAGMRICNIDEVQSCCGTGCWHNHHAIWVDAAQAGMPERGGYINGEAVQTGYQTHDQNEEARANRDNSTHEDYQSHREGIQDE